LPGGLASGLLRRGIVSWLKLCYNQCRIEVVGGGMGQPDDQRRTAGTTINTAGGANISDGTFTADGQQVFGGVGIDQRYSSIYLSPDQLAESWRVHGLIPNPYPGLRHFSETHYVEGRPDPPTFGRTAAVEKALSLLTPQAGIPVLLFVTGASGSGKSSFVRAGLLPYLGKHYARRFHRLAFASFRPGSQPLAGLTDALAQLGLTDEFGDSDFLTSPATFWQYVQANTPRKSASQPGQINFVLIDQFEELFTQADASQRDFLLTLLTEPPSFKDCRTHIVCTLRSDYLDDLAPWPAFQRTAQDGVRMREMEAKDLRETIQAPINAHADFKGKTAQPELIARLIEQASSDICYLPLLQVTLEGLWESGWLRLKEYVELYQESIGTALRQRADDVIAYVDFDRTKEEPRPSTDQTTLLALLGELVQLGTTEPVRRQRLKAELASDHDRARLLEDLIRGRLVWADRVAGVDVVNLIHESLLVHWPRLREVAAALRVEVQP